VVKNVKTAKTQCSKLASTTYIWALLRLSCEIADSGLQPHKLYMLIKQHQKRILCHCTRNNSL